MKKQKDFYEKEEVQIFLNNVEEVLNGRTFFIMIDTPVRVNKIKDEELIKNVISSKEFDLKLLEADLTQQDGDFFHELVEAGKFIPKVDSFPKSDLSICNLDSQDAYKYLVSMLTANSKNTFWSPYSQEISDSKAKRIINSFLNALGNKNEFRFYKLKTNFILQLSDFWDGLSSDSITAILTDDKLFFLFTNGGD